MPEGYGTDIKTGERTIILAIQWRELKAYIVGNRDVLRVDSVRLKRSGYDNIAFRRQAIMALWPPHRRQNWDGELPPTVRPDGPGYMPLYCAAHWIATKGRTIEFDPRDNPIWNDAYAELLARIASGEVTVTGIRDGAGGRPDPHLFASVRVAYIGVTQLTLNSADSGGNV